MPLFQTKADFYNILSGFCLFFMALGVNRFAYTPVIPFLIHEHWLTHAQAGYIGSANFLGYFIGALSAHKLNQKLGTSLLMSGVLFISVIAATASACDLGFWWLKVWRLVLGFNNGVIMILAPSIILIHLSDSQKAISSGIIFAGIGAGTFICSLLIPIFYTWNGMIGIWLGLATLTLILSLISLKKCLYSPHFTENTHHTKVINKKEKKRLTLALLGYCLYSIGLTPSLLFLSVFAKQTLGASLTISSFLFALFGIGCALGAICAGIIHHKLGHYFATILMSLIGIMSLLLIIWLPSTTSVAISAFLSGFYLMAIVTLMSLFISQLVGIKHHAKYWSYMTLSYAAVQFVASYAFSYGLSVSLSYIAMFKIGAIALTLSLLCYLCLPTTIHSQSNHHKPS